MAVCEKLKEGGLDPSRLTQASPYGAGGPGVVSGGHRNSWIENARGSVAELAGTEVDSAASSPGVQRVMIYIVSLIFPQILKSIHPSITDLTIQSLINFNYIFAEI